MKYIFTMSPLMGKIASQSEFIQCDITYDDMKDYPYIFNAVAFNAVSMEWMVVARVRINKQTSAAYGLAFKKTFDKCSSINPNFKLGTTLVGVLIDWSDAEANGLKHAVGKELAENLLKGCKVHWNRSCQRIADRIATSDDRPWEKDIFLRICYTIPKCKTSLEVVACFETLCGVRPANNLSKILPSLLSVEESQFIDECNWSVAKNWAQWWARREHLKMLSKVFTSMDQDIWDKCPSTTNAVERKNKDCKSDSPQCLKLSMLKVYKVDKVACLRHIAAEDHVSLSYRSRDTDALRAEAARKQKQRQKDKVAADRSAQFGPPDRASNFDTRK